MILSIKKNRRIVEIPIVQIRPCRTQARKNYNSDSLHALAQSIRYNGILQPVTVRKITPMEYELVAGERRLRAAVLCGYTKIPCIVISCTDNQAEILSLEENLQRSDLNCFEEAQGIHHWIQEYQLSGIQAARQLGKKPSVITEKISILHFDDEEKNLMIKAHLTEAHAKALLKVEDRTDRRIVLSEIIENSMNVSQSKQFIENYLGSTKLEKHRMQRKKGLIRDIRLFSNTIRKAILALKSTGLNPDVSQYENESYMEYVIRIPKTRANQPKMTA